MKFVVPGTNGEMQLDFPDDLPPEEVQRRVYKAFGGPSRYEQDTPDKHVGKRQKNAVTGEEFYSDGREWVPTKAPKPGLKEPNLTPEGFWRQPSTQPSPPPGFAGRAWEGLKKVPIVGELASDLAEYYAGQGSNMRPAVDPVDVGVAVGTGGGSLIPRAGTSVAKYVVPKVAAGAADIAGQATGAALPENTPWYLQWPATLAAGVVTGRTANRLLTPKVSTPPGIPVVDAGQVQGPPEMFGPAVPRGDLVRVGVVRKGQRGPAPTQSLLERAKGSLATPEATVPEVPPRTRRMLEGLPEQSRPPVALVEADMGPQPLAGTRGPSAAEMPTTPRTQRARGMQRTPSLGLEHDIPGERVNPDVQGSTQSTLQAARDLETGRALDLGEVGRRQAAARGRYAAEAAPLPAERPATETVVRRDAPPPVPPAVPPDPNAPAVRGGVPPGGAGGGAAPVGPRAPRPGEGPLVDTSTDLQLTVKDTADTLQAGRESLGPWDRFKGRVYELAPDRLLTIFRNGGPSAAKYADDATLNDMRWNAFVERHAKEATPFLARIRTQQDRDMLTDLLDTAPTPAQIAAAPPHVMQAYTFMRSRYTQLANELGLPQSARIADYYPHIFDTEQIRTALQVAQMQAIQAGNTAAAHQAAAMLKQMPQPGIGAKSKVPESVYAWMMQKRTGAGGFNRDPIEAYKAYVKRAADKLYVEPVYKSFLDNEINVTNPEVRRLMARHAADFGGRGALTTLDRWDSNIRGSMYWTKLAGNVTWPLWNVSMGQSSNAAYFGAQGDPGGWIRGLRWLGTAEGKALFNESGHTGVTGYHGLGGTQSQIAGIGKAQRIPEPVKQALLLWPDRVERVNRGGAFFGQLSHDMIPVYGEARFRQMLGQGINAIPEEYLIKAHRAVTETQGSYGARHDPEWLTRPGLRAASQFVGTGAKVLQGLLAKQGQSPLSRPIYLFPLYTEGLEEALKLTGMDASRIAGIGVDVKGFIKDTYEMNTDPNTRLDMGTILKHRVVDQWKEGRSGLFSFNIGPIVPALTERLPSAIEAGYNVARGRPGAVDEFTRAASPEVVAANRGLRAYRSSEYSSPLEVAGSFANIESERHRAFRRIIEGAERGLPGANAEMADFLAKNKNVLSPAEQQAWERAWKEGKQLNQAKKQWEVARGVMTPQQTRMENRPTTVRGPYEGGGVEYEP